MRTPASRARRKHPSGDGQTDTKPTADAPAKPAREEARDLDPVWVLSVANHEHPGFLGLRFALRGSTETYIGRSRSCLGAPVFESALVSGKHAKVSTQPGHLWLEDCGSKHGTTLNGIPITGRVQLVVGDVIGFGPAVVQLLVHRAPADFPIPAHDRLLGKSYALAKVLEAIELAAAKPVHVYLRGELGTGKELAARAVHDASRRSGRYIDVNCGGISEQLIESELFGHVRGAFTGANKDKQGRIQAATQGTLFLDEIENAPLELQQSLLRFLEDGYYYQVGGDEPIRADVRIVTASNADLEALCAQGKFREDFLSRIDQWRIELPPLRERMEDVPILATHFVRRFAKTDIPIAGDLMRALLRCPWRNNIRGLRNFIQNAVIRCGDHGILELKPELEKKLQLEVAITAPSTVVVETDDRHRENLDDTRVRAALREHQGNVAAVERALGFSRQAIYRHCERNGVDVNDYRPKK